MSAQTDIERSIWIALRDAHDALLIVAEGDLPEGLVDAAGFQELVAGAALQSVKEALNLHLSMGLVEAAADATREADEKSKLLNVVLTAFGEKKVEVIKVVRKTAGIGLKEAKALVDSAPSVVMEGVSAEQAEQMQKQLEAAGATEVSHG